MYRRISRFLRFRKTGAAALSVMCLIVAAASARSLPRGGDRIALIHRFLRTIYPELQRGPLQMTLEEQDRFARPTYVSGRHLSTFVVTLAPAPPCGVQQPPRKGSVDQGRPVGTAVHKPTNTFTGVFQFSDGELADYYSGSQLVNWDRLAAVIRLVDAHSEWSDGQVLQALAQAGAKYTPDNRKTFIAAIPKKELQEIFGPLKITSVQFLIRDKEQLKAGLNAAELFWQINATAGGQKQFHFDFEPFGGKLLSALIVRNGQAPAVQMGRAAQAQPSGSCQD